MRQSPTNYLLLAAFTLAEAVLAWHPKELVGFLKCQSKDPQTLEVPIDFLKRMASIVFQMRKKHPEDTGRFKFEDCSESASKELGFKTSCQLCLVYDIGVLFVVFLFVLMVHSANSRMTTSMQCFAEGKWKLKISRSQRSFPKSRTCFGDHVFPF